jgi:hypothetical protein
MNARPLCHILHHNDRGGPAQLQIAGHSAPHAGPVGSGGFAESNSNACREGSGAEVRPCVLASRARNETREWPSEVLLPSRQQLLAKAQFAS